MGTPALIALGSNLGDRNATLDRAIAELADSPGVSVRAVSTYHATAPVGGPAGQGAFLNAAAALETTLEPAELHRLLQDVERRAGRVREVRWDARTLDLDLILFGDQIIDTPELIVPHPRFAVRRFVLAPLAEVAPGARDPISGRTVRELLCKLDGRPSYLAIDRTLAPDLAFAIASEVAVALGARSMIGSLNAASALRFAEVPPGPPEQIESAARSLCSAWEETRGSDLASWLVSDFDLGREINRCLGIRGFTPPAWVDESPGPIERSMRRVARANVVVEQAPDPTITVLVGWQDPYARLNELVSGHALLVLDHGVRERHVAEILAACEASRAGIGTP